MGPISSKNFTQVFQKAPGRTWMIIKTLGRLFYGQMSQKYNFLDDKMLKWPSQSPDYIPIQMLWQDLKFLHSDVRDRPRDWLESTQLKMPQPVIECKRASTFSHRCIGCCIVYTINEIICNSVICSLRFTLSNIRFWLKIWQHFIHGTILYQGQSSWHNVTFSNNQG
jgi:hypothetical protein